MQLGNINISRSDMPSYVSPEKQPYHIYQSMQDVIHGGMGFVPPNNKIQQTPNANMENKQSMWDGQQ